MPKVVSRVEIPAVLLQVESSRAVFLVSGLELELVLVLVSGSGYVLVPVLAVLVVLVVVATGLHIWRDLASWISIQLQTIG